MATSQTRGTKRGAPTPDSADPPAKAPKRYRRRTLNFHMLKKLGYNFQIPKVIAKVRTKTGQPFDAGMALGVMLYYIVPLISTHLDNPVDSHSKIPEALQWATGFVEAIDQYVVYLRLTDGCSEKFLNDATVDRKNRRPRRKYMERYTHLVENAYKDLVREQLCDVFQSWNKDPTRLFNKGIDKALSGIQWVVYPEDNVVLAAGDNEWAIWLRGQCEELGMIEARAQRKVLEEM